jgi:hypothetical protein
VESHFSPFEIMRILTQDRCTIFTEHTIGSKCVLDAPDATPRRHGSCGILFGPFRDSVSGAKHNKASEIVLDALDGTPRLRGSSGCSIQSV